jgi:hypothetical protein
LLKPLPGDVQIVERGGDFAMVNVFPYGKLDDSEKNFCFLMTVGEVAMRSKRSAFWDWIDGGVGGFVGVDDLGPVSSHSMPVNVDEFPVPISWIRIESIVIGGVPTKISCSSDLSASML